jgi:hypothetical protein
MSLSFASFLPPSLRYGATGSAVAALWRDKLVGGREKPSSQKEE